MTTTHPFLNYIRKYVPISQKDWECIFECLEYQEVSKMEFLLREGQICRYLYFVEEGLLHFFFTRDGQEITKFFTEAPYCFTAQQSLTMKIPANEGIQALEDCKIWRIPATDAFRLLEIPYWSEFVRKLVQEVQFETEQIYMELQTQNAEARYQEMLLTQGDLLQRVPQKLIASYLGIAPQSLSRIRKKIVETLQS